MTTFESLGIEEGLLNSIKVLGFTEPTPIQEKAIPVLLQGTKDFIGLAQPGTGKTAAFGLPLLQLINKDDKFPQALIVCPTPVSYTHLDVYKRQPKVYMGSATSLTVLLIP